MRNLPVAVLTTVLGCTPSIGAQGPGPAQVPFETSIDIVAVDLTVLDGDGRPVRGLRPDDVTVLVDGAPRSVASLSFREFPVSRDTSPAMGLRSVETPPPPLSAAGALSGRRIVVVIDRDNLPQTASPQVLSATQAFVAGLVPGDRVALWTIPETTSTLSFSRDRDELVRAIGALTGTLRPSHDAFLVTLGEVLAIDAGDRATLKEVVARECLRAAGRAGGDCMTEVERVARQQAMDLRARADTSLQSLRALVDALAQFEGAKHVVFVSGVVPQFRDAMPAWRDLAAAAAAARVLVHAVSAPQAAADLVDMERTGLPATPQWTAQSKTPSAGTSLAVMTGGFSRPIDNLQAAFERLDREISGLYQLAFEAASTDRDGRPHAIDIRIGGRPGLTSRWRRQFRLDPSGASTVGSPGPETGTHGAGIAGARVTASTLADAVAGDVTLETLVHRVTDYVSRFLDEHRSVVIEERYVQIIKAWRGTPKSPDAEPALAWDETTAAATRNPIFATRRLRSDLLLVQASNQVPVAYRDVYEVDGRPVRDRVERVRDLFLSPDPGKKQQLAAIAAEGARYNLGGLYRTVNTPSFPLLYLRPASVGRLKLTIRGRESIGGEPCVIVEFKEARGPALVATMAGRDIMAWGRFWAEPLTGRIRQIEVRLETHGGFRRLLQVRYAGVARVGVLVPDRMWEWYEGTASDEGPWVGRRGFIECLATYGNVRRFVVETTEQVR